MACRLARRSQARQLDELPGRRRLADRHLDQHRSCLFQPAAQRLAQLGRRVGAQAHGPEALRQAHEVGVAEVAGNQPPAIVVLLHALDVAEGIVVEHDTDDRDAGRFLALFTFLPMTEIEGIDKLEGAALNGAKAVLAFETTRLAHGQEEAIKAFRESAGLFGVPTLSKEILPSSAIHGVMTGKTVELKGTSQGCTDLTGDVSVMPSSTIDLGRLKEGIPAFKLFHSVGLASSGGAARRLIEQGGGYVNGQRVEAFDAPITESDMNGDEITLRAGKKKYHRIKVAAE